MTLTFGGSEVVKNGEAHNKNPTAKTEGITILRVSMEVTHLYHRAAAGGHSPTPERKQEGLNGKNQEVFQTKQANFQLQ